MEIIFFFVMVILTTDKIYQIYLTYQRKDAK